MKPQQSFEEFAVYVDTELRRGYAGQLHPRDISGAVNRAVGHAWNERRRMVKVANPIGYLYRVGQPPERGGSGHWVPWDEDLEASGIHPGLSPALQDLPGTHATVVWLVRACGWTNVQAAEALDISAATVSSRVAQAMAQLESSLGQAEIDVESQLHALSHHRVKSIPEEIVAEEAEPEHSPARTPTWANATVIRLGVAVVAVVAVVALLGGGILVIKAIAGSDPGSPGLGSVSVSMGDRQMLTRSDWARPLGESGQPGTFALARTGEGFDTVEVAAPERARKPFSPASTFKILNALIILETDTLANVDAEVAWDGVNREFEVWNQDHSLRTGIAVSAVWMFQELARRVGKDAMAEFVTAADYGNRDISGDIDSFWLSGALRTSAIDQLAFLERLALGTLPFDPAHQEAVGNILTVEEGSGWKIRYKTGTVARTGSDLGWLVGIVDTDDGQWVFAYNVDVDSTNGGEHLQTIRDRLDLVRELLVSADVITHR